MTAHRPTLLISLAATCLLLALASPALAYDYSYARVVRLSLVDGQVQVYRPGAQDNANDQAQAGWEQAEVNLPIEQGYSLATGRGRAEVEFENGAVARLADNSVLQFTELALSGGGRITKLTLTQGTATFYANLTSSDSFVVATPHLQVTIPQNARFRVDVYDDGSQVAALKGEVQVDSSAGAKRLAKGESLSYRTSDPEDVTLSRDYQADDWDRWVADRDEVIRTSSNGALQYVSSPYTYGLADLYNYGSWYSVGSYGWCWRPYGAGLGWSPFFSGRWAFLPGFGWTWVSYEPWGWLPYHYGRWFFSPGLGWVWVPSHWNRWHPGQVSWIRAGDHVGWVPLHPQDQPGRTPHNLQHGVIIATRGSGGGIQRKLIRSDKEVEMMREAPRIIPGVTPSPTVRFIGPPVRRSPNGQGGSITFDPHDRRFVNNPNPPNPKLGKGDGFRDANKGTDIDATPHGPAQTPRPTPNSPPQGARVIVGGSTGSSQNGGGSGHRDSPPPPPPARMLPPPQRQQTAPVPHFQPAPRPQPSPAQHMQPPPRPSSPPPAHNSSGESTHTRSGHR